MSLFKKIFSSFSSKSEKDNEDLLNTSKYLPQDEPPVDEQFMLNFRVKGGKFLYCDSLPESMDSFNQILLENDWHEKNVCCFEEGLQHKFNDFNLKYSKSTKGSFYFGTCEYLIGNSGGILVSSNQLKEKKLVELPENFVIFAYTSQIISDISEGLKGIKNKVGKSIPTNITTIQHFEAPKENDFLSYGSSTKNLYLLLVEDL